MIGFHTYGRAMQMERLVAHCRQWLHELGGEAVPLWITECGRPWRKGPDRPPAGQDAESTLDVMVKAIEAQACGIGRYFAFVYPFYEEREWNFGMMDRGGTARRKRPCLATRLPGRATWLAAGQRPWQRPHLL